MKRIKEIVFSMVVVALVTVIGYQYKLSKKEEVKYVELHELSQEILDNSKGATADLGEILIDSQYSEKRRDTLRIALLDAESKNAKLYDLSKEYLTKLDQFDKAHKSLWEQYMALQADYNAYMDFVNSGAEMEKLIASIEGCAADNDSIKYNYNTLAKNYNEIYEYSESVDKEYSKLDSAYNALYTEYQAIYYEYVASEEEIVGL